jgi:hypothetical protein
LGSWQEMHPGTVQVLCQPEYVDTWGRAFGVTKSGGRALPWDWCPYKRGLGWGLGEGTLDFAHVRIQ